MKNRGYFFSFSVSLLRGGELCMLLLLFWSSNRKFAHCEPEKIDSNLDPAVENIVLGVNNNNIPCSFHTITIQGFSDEPVEEITHICYFFPIFLPLSVNNLFPLLQFPLENSPKYHKMRFEAIIIIIWRLLAHKNEFLFSFPIPPFASLITNPGLFQARHFWSSSPLIFFFQFPSNQGKLDRLRKEFFFFPLQPPLFFRVMNEWNRKSEITFRRMDWIFFALGKIEPYLSLRKFYPYPVLIFFEIKNFVSYVSFNRSSQ